MITDKVRLNITLPKNLVHMMDQMSGPRKRSSFIAEAIEIKIKLLRKDSLENQLADGYRAAYRESRNMASEFEPSDLEGWDDY